MDDGMAVDIVDPGHDALLKLVFRSYPNVAQNRASEFGEEALDQIQP